MPVFADSLPISEDLLSASNLSGIGFGSSMPTMTPLTRTLYGVLLVYLIVCLWKIFKKAGLPGWGSIIPIYNIVLWFKMAGRSGRRTLSLLCPPLFAIIMIISYFDVAKRFGKSAGFGLGLWFLGPIFLGILAFGKAQYQHK